MIVISENYRDLKSFKGFDILKEHGLGLLKETLESFFNCKASFLFEPIKQAKKHFGLALHDNPKRGCYPINNDCFFIYVRVLDQNSLISGIGVILSGKDISSHRTFMNHFEGALTRGMSKSYKKWFENCSLIFGDELILHAICNFSSRGVIDYRRFYHITSLFMKLRTTTFEGDNFSTGLILTKSHHAFRGKNGEHRGGEILPIRDKHYLRHTFKIDKRFWYLADGKQCYFIGNKDLAISHLFVLDDSYKQLGYVDSNILSNTLKGGDILLRVEGDGNLSIISSENIEFIYTENQWKIRNYSLIAAYLHELIENHDVINRLLFFMIYCAKSNSSTVIWIPSDEEEIPIHVKPETLNTLFYEPISILDNKFTNHIFRCLSSDGATIISNSGLLLNFGCVVDMSVLNIAGMTGTGESAARALSKCGIAIKVSQDGAIKIYLKNSEKPILV